MLSGFNLETIQDLAGGGNGKTTVLWYLMHHHDRSGRLHVLIDVGQETVRTGDHALLDLLVRGLAQWLPPESLDRYQECCRTLDRMAAEIRHIPLQVDVTISARWGGRVEGSPVTTDAYTALAKLVAIDAMNIDDTRGKARPVHSTLLRVEVSILTNGFAYPTALEKVVLRLVQDCDECTANEQRPLSSSGRCLH